MKKFCLCLLPLVCLLLCACGEDPAEEKYAAFAEELSRATALTCTASLRAEYEDRSERFTLRYEEDGEACRVTVLEPELVAGIRAKLNGDSASLEYEGLILDVGPLDAYGLTPVSSLPLLADTLRSGHLESCWTEGDFAVFQLIADDRTAAVVWFQGEPMTPVRAEIASDGAVRVFCELSDWKTNSR